MDLGIFGNHTCLLDDMNHTVNTNSSRILSYKPFILLSSFSTSLITLNAIRLIAFTNVDI